MVHSLSSYYDFVFRVEDPTTGLTHLDDSRDTHWVRL